MKIQVLPPGVNESHAKLHPVGNDIRFGLTAIRNVGVNVVEGIASAREEKGRYEDFNDFAGQGPGPRVQQARDRVADQGRRVRQDDGYKRRALVTIHETAVDQYIDIKKNEAIGQDSLFGGLDEADGGFEVNVAIPDIDGGTRYALLGHEREMLGLYVSDHPLLGLDPPDRHRLHHRPADARRGAAARLDA